MDKLLPSYLYRCLWPVIALYAGAMIMAVPAEQPWVRDFIALAMAAAASVLTGVVTVVLWRWRRHDR